MGFMLQRPVFSLRKGSAGSRACKCIKINWYLIWEKCSLVLLPYQRVESFAYCVICSFQSTMSFTGPIVRSQILFLDFKGYAWHNVMNIHVDPWLSARQKNTRCLQPPEALLGLLDGNKIKQWRRREVLGMSCIIALYDVTKGRISWNARRAGWIFFCWLQQHNAAASCGNLVLTCHLKQPLNDLRRLVFSLPQVSVMLSGCSRSRQRAVRWLSWS